MKNKILLIISIFFLISCNKLDLDWDIKRVTKPPIVNTVSANFITNISCLITSEVVNDGGGAITNRGICYSVDSNPTILNNIIINNGFIGIYESRVENLQPNTIYYFRAYAQNNYGISYGGNIRVITTNIKANLPEITTKTISSITDISAVSGGNISNDGGSSIISRGICYSLSQNVSLNDEIVYSGIGIGDFSCSLVNLESNTTYFVRSFAINSIGTAYGSIMSFKTAVLTSQLATLKTNNASSITTNSAVCGGDITNNGGSAVISRGLCYSLSQSPTLSDNVIYSGNGSGNYTANLTGLNSSTTYYIRAFATNGNGTAFGNQVSLTTLNPPPVLVYTNNCNSLNSISSLYSGMNGTTAPWGLTSNGYNGGCWVAPDPNKAGNLGTAVGTHFVEFSKTFTKNGYIVFWLNTNNPGYNNILPNIYIDGVSQGNPTMIGGQVSSFYFMQVKTDDISAGSHTIKIEFTGSYYDFYIDELNFYEYQ